MKQSTHAIVGITAYQQLERMNFSMSFIGMNGISLESGLTTTNLDEVALKECAMQQSHKIRILMDDSKINQVYEFKVKAPSQAIIVLNEEAKKQSPTTIEKLSDQFDFHFIKG